MEGDYINVSPSLKIPPLTEIRELIHASQEVEKSSETLPKGSIQHLHW